MARKIPRHLIAAASKARAARTKKSCSRSPSSSQEDKNGSEIGRSGIPGPPQHDLVVLDETDDESECGYEGGVENPTISDDEFIPGWELEDDDDDDWNSDEELSEYDEEEMEQLKEAADLMKPTPFEVKENMPTALTSVPLETIRQWEHRTQRWMEAYRSGMETRDAQKHVRTFSSRIYK